MHQAMWGDLAVGVEAEGCDPVDCHSVSRRKGMQAMAGLARVYRPVMLLATAACRR